MLLPDVSLLLPNPISQWESRTVNEINMWTCRGLLSHDITSSNRADIKASRLVQTYSDPLVVYHSLRMVSVSQTVLCECVCVCLCMCVCVSLTNGKVCVCVDGRMGEIGVQIKRGWTIDVFVDSRRLNPSSTHLSFPDSAWNHCSFQSPLEKTLVSGCSRWPTTKEGTACTSEIARNH